MGEAPVILCVRTAQNNIPRFPECADAPVRVCAPNLTNFTVRACSSHTLSSRVYTSQLTSKNPQYLFVTLSEGLSDEKPTELFRIVINVNNPPKFQGTINQSKRINNFCSI